MTWLVPLLLACLACFAMPAQAEEPQGLRLTTDTPQYCTQLVREVTSRHSPVGEIQRLLTEGREMCERGQTRGGILRLRRALVMLHHHTPRADAPSQP